ncbi:DUF5690 family protein [Elizabethkingia sp. JS20170427COW]|uniref:DUF5690 family protein n=1 Tax=Elizabethkingia sp. JS20170427COW TaxID=2583851 RepID=UPI0021072843|nr:DUF5690 family protein [Elizabethkingia sp. JS20170427COW]
MDASNYWNYFPSFTSFFINLLEKIPSPSAKDISEKSERTSMTKEDHKKVLKRFVLPFAALITFYTLLTAFRDFRDNFARELWDNIGYSGDISVYSTSELIISLIVLFIFGSLFFIKNNIKALSCWHAMYDPSYLLLSTRKNTCFFWMIISGFGMYICYIPFNALFFDRFIAAFKIKGNAGFLKFT